MKKTILSVIPMLFLFGMSASADPSGSVGLLCSNDSGHKLHVVFNADVLNSHAGQIIHGAGYLEGNTQVDGRRAVYRDGGTVTRLDYELGFSNGPMTSFDTNIVMVSYTPETQSYTLSVSYSETLFDYFEPHQRLTCALN